ncbi:hypothetical protein GCM10009122_26360 [Fulvivirga kasyanovii]|uniref:XRE family transcriptional regulator n=1 Tax=Fulvivirga kasyanovii TaxID=396812 RepID=A0ABW9RLI0_9BACT|nr:helix-turn-helix transcriptional regulator [Fulvivirga kasyanovii]MTI23760.1 XRE family transcriptional regulator [Fulvivirga kasyanovii]
MIKTTIEERIFFYRNLINCSQAELARRIGAETGKEPGRDVMSQYESGKRKVPSELVPVLAKIFGITADELFYKTEINDNKLDEAISGFEKEAEVKNNKLFQEAIAKLKEANQEIRRLKMENATYKKANEDYEHENARLSRLIENYRNHASMLFKDPQFEFGQDK